MQLFITLNCSPCMSASRREPDATSLLWFRHLLEKHKLGEALFAEAGQVLQDSGMTLKAGTIVSATLISAPSNGLDTAD